MWYSRNDGKGWGPEILIGNQTNSKNPSIAVTYPAGVPYVHVVWEATETPWGDPIQATYYRQSTNNGQTWETVMSLTEGLGDYTGVNVETTPVVSSYGTVPVVVWRYNSNPPGGLAMRAAPSLNSSVFTISGSTVNSRTPSLNGQSSMNLAFEDAGNIYYREFTVTGNYSPYYPGGMENLISEHTYMTDCARPSITTVIGDKVLVSWDSADQVVPVGEEPDGIDAPLSVPGTVRRAYFRERAVGGGWGSPVGFSYYGSDDVKTTIGVDNRAGMGQIMLQWQWAEAGGAKTTLQVSGGLWSSINNLGLGFSPSLTNYVYGSAIPWQVWTGVTGTPYAVIPTEAWGTAPTEAPEGTNPRSEIESNTNVVFRRATIHLDSISIGGLPRGAVTGSIVLETSRPQLIFPTGRHYVPFDSTGTKGNNWMGTRQVQVPEETEAVAMSWAVGLFGVRTTVRSIPLSTPVLSAEFSGGAFRQSLRTLRLADILVAADRDTVLGFSVSMPATSIRGRSIGLRQKLLGEDAGYEPAWSELIIADTALTGRASSLKKAMVVDEKPTAFALHQNYPNPFNPVTQISYDLPIDTHVTLKVYDMLGREVATLVDGQMTAGRHDARFDAVGIASGVYLYRITAGTFTDVKKLTLVR